MYVTLVNKWKHTSWTFHGWLLYSCLCNYAMIRLKYVHYNRKMVTVRSCESVRHQRVSNRLMAIHEKCILWEIAAPYFGGLLPPPQATLGTTQHNASWDVHRRHLGLDILDLVSLVVIIYNYINKSHSSHRWSFYLISHITTLYNRWRCNLNTFWTAHAHKTQHAWSLIDITSGSPVNRRMNRDAIESYQQSPLIWPHIHV